MDIERLLNRDQKEEIIKAMVLEEMPNAKFRVRYDRRYGYDFGAYKRGEVISVIVATSITDPRFKAVVHRVVQALHSFKTNTHATTIRGKRRIEA